MSNTVFINLDNEQVVETKALLEAYFEGQSAFTYQTTTTTPLTNVVAMTLSCRRPDDVISDAESILARTV